MIEPQVDEVAATTGVDIKTVTADAGYGYAYAKVYGALERRGIDALIPTNADPDSRATASVLVGCQERHREAPARQDPAIRRPSCPRTFFLRSQASSVDVDNERDINEAAPGAWAAGSRNAATPMRELSFSHLSD
jgi:hypothetical protein